MHPTLFRIGPIHIYSYGVMLMLAFVAGIFWASREAKRRGVEAGKILDLALWILGFSMIFARLVFILLDLKYYLSQPLSALIFSGGRLAVQGLSFHGGLIGAALGAYWFSRRTKLSWLLLADICAPAAALGYGIARLGCFLNGCCYGVPTNLPWGVRFLMDPDAGTWTAACHPTQIYSALGSWLIFVVLLKLRGKLHYRGQLFFAYLGIYSVMRFLIEFLRKGVSAEVAVGSLTQAQVACIIILAFSIFLFYYLRQNKKPSIFTQNRS